jgi:hypothetical protein
MWNRSSPLARGSEKKVRRAGTGGTDLVSGDVDAEIRVPPVKQLWSFETHTFFLW